MQIEVTRIPPEGRRFTGEEPNAILDLEADASVVPEGPVRYDLLVNVVTGELLVRGSLDLEVSFRCSRCAEWFRTRVAEPRFDWVHELRSRTDCVELTPEIREGILAAFPAHPVCRVECRGLCSHCGANLNRKRCRCVASKDARWNALDGLKL